MSEASLRLQNAISGTIESLKMFLIKKFNYINNIFDFLKKMNQITINSYNSIENSIEDLLNNKECVSDIYKNIDNYSEKINILKEQVNTLEYISNELNIYSKKLEYKCQQLLK
ncbi:hypothetical protein PCANB_000936 [Pneumocystis canis]|nr:hypothetical protein PCANB_000936 [Pneumocystis canis]